MTTIHGGHDAFLAAIAARPKDPGPKLVYTDWLEERGEPAGAAVRACAALGNWPQWYKKTKTWDWWTAEREIYDNGAGVPEVLFGHLKMWKKRGTCYREYPSPLLACIDLAQAVAAHWRGLWR